MNTGEFEQYLSEQQGQPYNWNTDMLPKINDVVWRSLKAVQETQEQRNNTFEIYGFDIVLDESFNPWVIEINLSPACAERAEWLSKMLDDSHVDLLSHIENKILVTMGIEHWGSELKEKLKEARIAVSDTRYSKCLNTKSFYDKNSLSNRWLRIPESVAEIKLYTNSWQQMQQNPDFQLVVYKANLQFEKRLEKSFKMEQAAKLIQRVWIGMKSRSLARSIRQNRASIVIQKFARRFNARRQLLFLRQTKFSIRIQKWVRMFQAQKLLNKLKAQRLLQQQLNLVLVLQSLWRRKIAYRNVMLLRKQKAALLVQKVMRGYKSRQQALRLRDHAVKVIRIQRYYRLRYKKKLKAVVQLQSQLRRYVQRNQLRQVLPIFRGSTLANLIAIKWQKKNAFIQLLRHKSAVTVQKCLRRFLVRNQVRKLRVLKAQQTIKKIATSLGVKARKQYLSDFLKAYVQKVIKVQQELRSYLQHRRQQKLNLQMEKEQQAQLEKERKDRAATVIQCQLRRILAIKSAEWAVIELGAVQMIQSCWRGYLSRRKLKAFCSNETESLQPQQQNETLKNQSKLGKFINIIEQQRYLKKEKQQMKVEHVNQSSKQKVVTNSVRKPEKSDKMSTIKAMPYQTSDAWSIFNKRKKELKNSYFGPGNQDFQGSSGQQRSVTGNQSLEIKEQTSEQKQLINQTQLVHTTKLETEVSFQELNETSITLNSLKSPQIDLKSTKFVAQKYENMTLNQLKIKQQKQAMKIQKSFAQNLQEILEQQKIATVGQVSKLMSQVERASLGPSNDLSAGQKQQLNATKVAPYLQPPSKLSTKPTKSTIPHITPTTELKSNFQQTFENVQQHNVIEEVVLARSSYNKAHKVFTQSAAEMFNQIRSAQNKRLEAVKHAHLAAQQSSSVYSHGQVRNKSVHSVARASGTQLFL